MTTTPINGHGAPSERDCLLAVLRRQLDQVHQLLDEALRRNAAAEDILERFGDTGAVPALRVLRGLPPCPEPTPRRASRA